ncbi:MAG: DUF2252 domain-containing protein [Steroidobacteraceae bacterium]|jgi:uncharacterized protein (DUF2252 family)
MARLSSISRQILAQNAGRDVERLLLKMQAMRQDPFGFFRGTNPLFLQFLPRGNGLFRAPNTLVCGDLHFENLGAFKGDNRLVYFDINDFDEACVAPFTVDIVRFLACIGVAKHGLLLNPSQGRQLMDAFMASYCAAVRDGKPRWIERSLATGIFRTLLHQSMRRTREELLDRFSKVKDGKRCIRIDGGRTLPLHEGEKKRLKKFLKEFRRGQPDRGFFRWLDASRRIMGNGSLGLPRYLLLISGRGSPDQNFALDLKYAAPSAVASWLGRKQPEWSSEAQRVVAIQRIMQAISPALLRAVGFDRRPFTLKELQPSVDRFEIARWRGKPRRILEAVRGMGQTAAWAHLRGCGHFDAAKVEALQTYVAATAWRRRAVAIGESAASDMLRAWKIYSKDYDAGAVAAAIVPP